MSCSFTCEYLACVAKQFEAGLGCMQEGPHFADWGEMQREGAVSMTSVPVMMNTEVVAALTLGSSQPAVFNE